MFGSTTTSSNHSIGNPFPTKPFGITTFGSPIGMSNGTTTGLFGETPSPFQSTTTFNVPSAPSFGDSKPAFESFSSAPTLGFSSAPGFWLNASGFGGSSVIGQKPACGPTSATEAGFSSTPTFGNTAMVVGIRKDLNGTTNSSFGIQSSFSGSQVTTTPFARTTVFGSPIGMSNSSGCTTGLFGETPSPFQSTTTFTIPSSPAFGNFSSASALGFSSSGFGAFGEKPVFGTSSPTEVGSSSAPTFGNSTKAVWSGKDFNGTTNASFGTQSSFSVFGQKPAFGTSSPTEVGSSSAPTFGNSTKAVWSGKDVNGTTNASFGTQCSFSGSQVTTTTFGSQTRGSRMATYERTVEIGTNAKKAENLESISAMSVYKDKSHEELRCEDYQFGDKGGIVSHNLNPFSATSPSTSQAFPSLNFFFSSTTSPSHDLNPNSATSSSTSQPFLSLNFFFSSTTSPSHDLNPFSATTPSPSQAFPSLNFFFSSTTSPSTVSTKSLTTSHNLNPFSSTTPSRPFFSSTTAPTTISTKSLTTSCTPSTSVAWPDFSFRPIHPLTSIPYATLGIHSPLQAPGPASFSTDFNSPAIGGSSFVNSTSTTSVPLPSTTLTIPPPLFASSSSISHSNSSPGVSTGLGFTSNQPSALLNSSLLSPAPHTCIAGENSGHNVIAQGSGSHTTADGHWSSGVNPFGSLPPVHKMSIDGAGSSPRVQYGISNLPVSLFNDNNEIPNSLFVPRENPKALVIRPSEYWPLSADPEKSPGLGEKLSTIHLNENGENWVGEYVSNYSDTPNLELAKDLTKVRDLELKVLEVEALLPKLKLSGYYTEPRIQELAAKERQDPGFCSRVKNFVVGRHGYGSIMFLRDIDVRKLDLESCIQFNYQEVIIYEDESKKPPVGQGLNNLAVVTLLNIKCTDKKTGNQFLDGPKVDKYREMLMKAAAAQGAEFVSYDPVGGEWKFRVQHF